MVTSPSLLFESGTVEESTGVRVLADEQILGD